MTTRLLKFAAPAIAALGVLAVTVPAEARCYYDGWGNRVCHQPRARYYAPPPPVYYAPPPPRYYAPRPVVNFGLAF